MKGLRTFAIWGIGSLVVVTTAVSFLESYLGLLAWAVQHHYMGYKAYIWPLQIDVFIAVGELALVLALASGWDDKFKRLCIGISCVGLVVSVAANAGHVHGALPDKLTAAVPPLSAYAALAVGMMILKRLTESAKAEKREAAEKRQQKRAQKQPAESTEAATEALPSIRQLQLQYRLGFAKAKALRAKMERERAAA